MNPDDPEEVRRRRLARLGASPPSAGGAAPTPVTAPPAQRASPPARAPAQKRPAQASPVTSPTAPASVKKPVPVERALRRVLRCSVVDGPPRATGEVFEVTKAEVNGALDEKTCGAVVALRLQRAKKGEDALQVLHAIFVRCRDEVRAARSRQDPECEKAVQACGDTSASLAAIVLARPGAIGACSQTTRMQLANALLGTGPALRAEFLTNALAKVSADLKVEVAKPLIDQCCVELKKADAAEVNVDKVCGALTTWLRCAGKKVAGAALAAHEAFAVPSLERPANGDAAVPENEGFAALLGQAGMAQGQAAQWGAMLRGVQQSMNRGLPLEKTCLLGLLLRVSGGANYKNDVPLEIQQRALRDLIQRVHAPKDLPSATRELSQRVSVCREAVASLVEGLVRNGPVSRDIALRWLAALLNRSKPGRHVHAAPSTRLGACGAWLRLCRPFLGDVKKEANAVASLDFLTKSPLGKAAYPADLACVNVAPMPDAMDVDSDQEMYDDDELKAALKLSSEPAFHFVTQCFFLCSRAVTLGFGAELERVHGSEQRAYQLGHRVGWDDPRVRILLAEAVAREGALVTDAVVDDVIQFSACQCRWLLRLSDDDLRRCPEFMLEDVCNIPCGLNGIRPDILKRSKPATDLLALCARLLGATDTLVKSPHAREKLGKALYDLFLPVSARGKTYDENMMRHPLSEHPGNMDLLANASPELASKLCPAILWLFGDAEYLGDIYQIADQRLRVAALVRHLWAAPVHRAAFRTIVADVRAFVTFANGLLNETNKLVAGAMEHLPEIRNHQVRTGQIEATTDEFRRLREEYEGANETRKEELDSRHADHERHLKQELELCTEILGLVELQTGDAAVSKAFMGQELRSRLAGMLLSVVRQFTGKRSLDIKISSPEQYGFDPKDILSRVGRIATHFSNEPEFPGALAESGYYDAELLPRCAQTLRRLGALSTKQLDALDALATQASTAREALSLDDGLENEAPEEFVDPLTAELMTAPVKLPSGHVVDDSTIRQHLLNELSDPFSRQPLEPADVVPLPELRARIEAWLAGKRAERRAARGG